MNNISLNDVYSDWITNGFFYQLTTTYDVPWKNIVDGNVLDLDYHGNKSGEKLVSPLIEKLLVDGVLNDNYKSQLTKLVYDKYNLAWTKAWEALNTEYKPLENYSMLENGTDTSTNTNTSNITNNETANTTESAEKTNTGTSLDEEDSSSGEDISNENTTTTKNNIYGFDSTSGSPSDDALTRVSDDTFSNLTANRMHQRTDDLKENNSITNETTKDITGTTTDNGSGEQKHNLTRSGNIGVTTSQQMLESELKLRFDWNYFNLIYKDADEVLTVNIFKE